MTGPVSPSSISISAVTVFEEIMTFAVRFNITAVALDMNSLAFSIIVTTSPVLAKVELELLVDIFMSSNVGRVLSTNTLVVEVRFN